MSDNHWAVSKGDDVAEAGYRPWVTSNTGLTRDLEFHPAKGSGDMLRHESLLQVISVEMRPDGTALFLMCHSSGQLVSIKGRGLDDLRKLIRDKRVSSLHVWSETDGEAPSAVITSLRFDKTFSQLAQPKE